MLVFAPYLEEDGALLSPHYDPPEYRAEIGSWLEAMGMDWEWVPITSRTLDAEVARARAMATADGGVIVFNLWTIDRISGLPSQHQARSQTQRRPVCFPARMRSVSSSASRV